MLAVDLLPWGCVGVSSFPTAEKKGCLRGLHTEPYLYRLKEDTDDMVVSLCTCKTTLCGLVSMFTQPIQCCVRQVRWETTSGAGTDISIHREAS